MCRFIQHPCFVLQNSLGARVCVEEVPAERTSGSCLSSFSIERQVGGVSSLAEKTDFVRGVQSMLQKHYSQFKHQPRSYSKTLLAKGCALLNSTEVQSTEAFVGFLLLFFLSRLASKVRNENSEYLGQYRWGQGFLH